MKFIIKNKLALIVICILILTILYIVVTNFSFINKIYSGKNFTVINIPETNLQQKDSAGVNLSGDDLSNKDLTGTILSGVDLSGQDLSNTDLTGANLSGTILTGANLSGTDLTGANLSSAGLTSTNLTGATLSGVDLSGADLIGTDLTGANLSGTDLTGTNLRRAGLTGTNLTGAILNGVDLRSVDLRGANLSDVDLSGKDLSGTNLRGAILIGTNLTGVDLTTVDLRGVDLRGANLSDVDLSGIDFSGKDLSGTNLSGAILIESGLTVTNLTGAILNGVDLRGVDLRGANLSDVDLSGKDLSGTNLRGAILIGTNLSDVDLSGKDLTGANLTGVDLSGKDLSGTSLQQTNLTGTNLRGAYLKGSNLAGVDLSGKDLSGTNLRGANLTGANFSETNFSGANLSGTKKIQISIQNTINSNWPKFYEIQNLNVSNFDLSGDVKYLTTKEGLLYELKNEDSNIVLNLNDDSQFPFTNETEGGLLSVVSNNKFVYISYSSQGLHGTESLVVDEYSMNFKNVRNIIKIGGFEKTHFGGNLLFDNLGNLYLSVGDGEQKPSSENPAQNLNSLRGKILRLDISELKLEPEIVAYGLRNPWGVSIDSKDRMFILDCGWGAVESVYLLNDLYSDIPSNLGWPVFQGTMRISEDPLKFQDTLAPIYEYKERPGCATGGFYFNDLELYLFGDFYGVVRLLKEHKNGEWYLFHEYKQDNADSLKKLSIVNNAYTAELMDGVVVTNIWSLGFDKKSKKIFIGPHNYELKISIEPIKLDE